MKRILILFLFSSSALAQPAQDPAALEASGNKHFQLAEYDAAIKDFKEAFRISDSPGYLYNIAQAYRLKGDCREAATFYKNYLRRVPDAPNNSKVRDRVKEMEDCAAKQPAPPPTTTTTTTTTTQPDQPPPQPEQPENPNAWMRYAGYGALAVGAIGLGLGIKFMLDGQAANDKLADTCMSSCTSEEALQIQNDGQAANRNAAIFSVAGGVFVAGGVVLVLLSMRSAASSETADEPAASVSFTQGGALASYRWTF